MFSFIPAIILFPIHLTLQILNLGLWGMLVILLGLVKVVLPFAWVNRLLNPIMNRFMLLFGCFSVLLIKLTNKVECDYNIKGKLTEEGWYLMMPNHLSYLDIILLIDFARGKIPAPKFFLKKELIWLPFVGLAAWALDMPFMQRYSRAFLEKHPHLKGKDIETTKKYCERFKHQPTTVINFVEGTRYTPDKKLQKDSGFENLLPPKAGGVAFTLAAMGELFTNVLDVTLLYPDNSKHPMMDMLSGRLNKIVIHVDVLPVDEDIIGDYFESDTFKARFQSWLNNLWARKDQYITQLTGGK